MQILSSLLIVLFSKLGDVVSVGFDQSEAGALGEATHVHSSLDMEISVESPVVAPRVLHDPVVHAIFVGSLKNKQ